MEKFQKTLTFTIIFSFIVIVLAIFVQLKGESQITFSCSYLDPVTIDILAFLASIFLIVEGVARISEHKNASIKRQFTRILRIGIGFAVLTLHIMQFVHK